MVNILCEVRDRRDFREWLMQHHAIETECWVIVKRGFVQQEGSLLYLDAVEEALCFGWIDSVLKSDSNIGLMQRFSLRRKNSVWSELNKERCRRLERLGLMTPAGRAVLPDMSATGFIIDPDVLQALQSDPQIWSNFCSFPPLYQRVRVDTVQRVKNKNRAVYERSLKKLLDNTKQNIMFGEWNDRGRLL